MASPAPFIFEARIRYIDTDASGRIHYTCMFRYFESAELEFMRSLGISYVNSEYGFPRVHVECDYILPLVFDDLVQIEVCLTQLGRSSVRFEFRSLKLGDLAATGAIVVACMNRKTQRSAPLPDDLRAKLAPALLGSKTGDGDVGSGRSNS